MRIYTYLAHCTQALNSQNITREIAHEHTHISTYIYTVYTHLIHVTVTHMWRWLLVIRVHFAVAIARRI